RRAALRRRVRAAPVARGGRRLRARAVDERDRARPPEARARHRGRAAAPRGPADPLPRDGGGLPGAPPHDRDPGERARRRAPRGRGDPAARGIPHDLRARRGGRHAGRRADARAPRDLPRAARPDGRTMTTTRNTLIGRIKDSGDAAAWEEFFELYAP